MNWQDNKNTTKTNDMKNTENNRQQVRNQMLNGATVIFEMITCKYTGKKTKIVTVDFNNTNKEISENLRMDVLAQLQRDDYNLESVSTPSQTDRHHLSTITYKIVK